MSYSTANIGFLLASCPRFSEQFFFKVIKKWELKNLVATKYYYEFFIHMKSQGGRFYINDISNRFLYGFRENYNSKQISEFENKILSKSNILSNR